MCPSASSTPRATTSPATCAGLPTSGAGRHWWVGLTSGDLKAHQPPNTVGQYRRPVGWERKFAPVEDFTQEQRYSYRIYHPAPCGPGFLCLVRTRPVFQSQVRVREHSVGPGPASPQTDKRGAVVRGVIPVLRRELDDRPTRTGHLGFRAHARGCEDGRHLGPAWVACPGDSPSITGDAAGTWRLGDLAVNRLGFGAMRLTGDPPETALPVTAVSRSRCCGVRSSSGLTTSTPPRSTSPRCAQPTS